MQYRRKIHWRLLLPLFIGLFFVLLLTNKSENQNWFERVVSNFVYPFQWSAKAVASNLKKLGDHYIFLGNLARKNEELVSQVEDARGKILKLADLANENQQLKSLLNLKEEKYADSLAASVIAFEPRSEFKTVTIDKGKADGVKSHMPVLSAKGLVGRIGPVLENRAQVLLIVDPNSAVDVIIDRSRVRSLVVGTSKRIVMKHTFFLTRLEYLRNKSDVQLGDIVMTSGMDPFFPKGIPVGSIEKIEGDDNGIFQHADVVPFVDFQKLEKVLILRKLASK